MMEHSGGGGRQHAEKAWDEHDGAEFGRTVGSLRVKERPLRLAQGSAGDRVDGQDELQAVSRERRTCIRFLNVIVQSERVSE